MRKKYRTQLASIERRLDNVDRNAFAAFQQLAEEVQAVQATLGPNPHEGFPTVADRLTALARRRFPWRFRSPIARR